MQSHTLRFWLVTLATAITMAVTASLGLWQLGRANQKLALQARMDERIQLPAWRETDLLRAADPGEAVYRPVQLRGTWVP
ncbi:MAG: SURF1 family protein, partial [Hydrogenophaga sp.]|nr:SURF1 family protein [Hydrogenophaga sp.]